MIEEGKVLPKGTSYPDLHPTDIVELFASKIGLTDEEQLKDLEEGLYEMACNLNNPHEFEYRKTTYYVLSELAEVLKKRTRQKVL